MKNVKKFYDERSAVYNFSMNPGSLYDKIFTIIGSNKKILDVGCANGNFAKLLKENGNLVYGIEVSPVMARNAKKFLDRVIVGNIEEIELPWKKKTFDVILLMDVLEHLFLPEDIVKNLSAYLKTDGTIIISIPNIANWQVRWQLLFGKFDSSKTAILEEGHIRFFTFDSAKQMFEKNQLVVVKHDLVMNLPLFILKIHNRFPFLHIKSVLEKYFYRFFGYQFIFILQLK